MPARAFWPCLWLVAACASGRPAPGARPPPPRAAPAPSAASALPPLPLPPARLPTPAAEPALDVEIAQVLNQAVSSIALGEGSRIAVLADPPQVAAGHGWKALPLPASLRRGPSETDHARIFFGRDNEPRIMGARRSQATETAIYWRHTAAGWRDGRDEIGRLGATASGGLWGVLGGEDPELVCRAQSLCIIKRSTGWTTAPAGLAPRIVTLRDGTLWGLDPSGLAAIDARGWSLVVPAPPWSEPQAFWAMDGEAWVSTPRALFHFHAGAWSSLKLPLQDIAAGWGTRPNSIWWVGKGGVAHFDGTAFRTAEVPGPLRTIRGRSDEEVWLGGDSGLFRARLREP